MTGAGFKRICAFGHVQGGAEKGQWTAMRGGVSSDSCRSGLSLKVSNPPASAFLMAHGMGLRF